MVKLSTHFFEAIVVDSNVHTVLAVIHNALGPTVTTKANRITANLYRYLSDVLDIGLLLKEGVLAFGCH